MISTVIFDLDGLLSDTERLHRQAYQDVMRGHGVEISDEVYEEHWIRAGKGIGDFIGERHLGVSPDVIRVEKAARYKALVAQSVRPMPGAIELLTALKGRKTLALASSSHADAVQCVIDALNIRDFFALIASKDDIERAKPWPDVFLRVARELRVAPAECVVLEDSEKGVVAAHRAGMPCIAVPNSHTRNHDFSKATVVVKSLLDVSLRMIEGMA